MLSEVLVYIPNLVTFFFSPLTEITQHVDDMCATFYDFCIAVKIVCSFAFFFLENRVMARVR